MGTLKDNIQHDFLLLEPKSLEHAFTVVRKFENKIMGTRKSATYNYKEGSVVLNHPQPTMLMQWKIEEKGKKIFFIV